MATTRLNKEWNIIFPDMRGNGDSMTRRHINLPTWCADLSDILSEEQARPAVVLGHSLGAQIAIHFADRYQLQTGGLILIDPVFQSCLQGRSLWIRRCRYLVQGVVTIILALNRLGLHRRNFRFPDLRKLDAETRKALQSSESFEEIERRYSALGPILKAMPIANYLRQALATVSPLPPLAGIRVPVLALLSGSTTVGNLDISRREVAKFSDSETVILNANHWPLTETPDAVRGAIEEWILRGWAPTK